MPDPFSTFQYVIPLFLVIVFLANALKVLPEYERGVLFRLGRLQSVKGPGLIFIIPVVDRLVRVSLRMFLEKKEQTFSSGINGKAS